MSPNLIPGAAVGWRRVGAGWCLGAASLLAACSPAGDRDSAVREACRRALDLTAGQAVEISPAQSESIVCLAFEAAASQRLEVVVEQRGVDVELRLLTPAGEPLAVQDRLIDYRGPEHLLAVSQTAGRHHLVITPLARVGGGHYRVELGALRAASERDRALVAAYRDLAAARATIAEAETLPELRRIAQRFRDLGEPVGEGEALDAIGDWFGRQRQWRRAASAYGRAASLFEGASETVLAAYAGNRQGAVLIHDNRPRAALPVYHRSLDLARRLENPVVLGKAHHGLGQCHQRLGELQQALEWYRGALAFWEEPYHEVDRAYTLHNLGMLFLRPFRNFDLARDHLQRAAAISRARGYAPELRDSLSALALVEIAAVDPEAEALTAGERSALEAAAEDLTEALRLGSSTGDCSEPRDLARLAVVEGRLGVEGSPWQRAERAERLLAEEVCKGRRDHGFRLLGEIYLRAGEAQRALELSAAARRWAEEEGDSPALAVALAVRARALVALGREPEALSTAARAMNLFSRMRLEVAGEERRSDLIAAAHSHRQTYVDLLVGSGRSEVALEAVEAGRARSFHDRLTEIGAGPGGGPPALRPRIRSAAQMQALLQPGEVLLVYHLGEERSYLWEVDSRKLALHQLADRSTLELLARAAVDDLRRRDRRGSRSPAVCRLAGELLGPLARRLAERSDEHLAISADGALQTVPFGALPHPAQGNCESSPWLIESHPVSSVPSLSVVAQMRSLSAERAPAGQALAAVGDAIYSRDDERCPSGAGSASVLPRLPGSGREVATVCRANGGDCFVGAEASKELLLDGTLADYRWLLLAVHGRSDEAHPGRSRLVFTQRDGDCRAVTGSLFAYQLAGLRLGADLTVLSACESGQGRQVLGEGLVNGLVRGFFVAGSPRVIASLWQVEDEGTADLVADLFASLSAGAAPARALQQAQVRALRSGAPPHRWAPLVLQGDWR
ncbi:MAG: CHAT domain-containing tetratricopeptide repeat protein [Acidobacteriota bacterium]